MLSDKNKVVEASAQLDPQPVEELLQAIKSYNPNSDETLIRRAYDFGMRAHQGQFRKSGEPYFCHPVCVAQLLTEIRIDDASIVTALLHDTIEDTGVGYEDVEREFGKEIAEFVNGVTKLTNLELGKSQSEEIENLRKLLLAVSKDVRVLLVKLADRLHNMRTIKAMPADKQRKKARETMEIYAPLAGRMGMQTLRDELEDLAFQVLNPQARASIMRKFIHLRGKTDDLLPVIIADIETVLAEKEISAVVNGREKKPYSIWRKIQSKGEGFERLSDIYGFRIITDDVADCYRALGAVHERWAAIPGRFKDYISQPKNNGYRSIHTSVSGRDGKRVEIQIRTKKMHIVAESGIASHWAYKDGLRVKNPYVVDPSDWLSDLSTGINEEDDDDVLEHFRMEMYSDQVFVFSPKGKVVRLPRGATAIDFAYAIHTDLGNHAVGAMIDGKRVPLSTSLRNGQTVHIVRAEGAHPERHWAQTAKTGRARAAIRRAFNAEQRAHDVHLGNEIARVAFDQIGKKMTDKALDRAAKELNIPDRDTLLCDLAKAEITSKTMIHAIYPELANDLPERAGLVALAPMIGHSPAYSSYPARCCMPLPGDRIVGLARKGEGICYHIIDCDVLAQSEGDENTRWIDLTWPDERAGAMYNGRVIVSMANDMGTLGRICTIIGENNANIEQLDFVDRRPDFFSILFEISVRDSAHLYNIITAIETDQSVSEAKRYRDELATIQEIAKDEGES